MYIPASPERRKIGTFIRMLPLIIVFASAPFTAWAATYSNGVFQLDDPGGKYTIRLTFTQSDWGPVPVAYEARKEVNPTTGYELDMTYFNLDDPQTDAVLTWEVTGDLATSVSLSRSNYLWDWSSRVGIVDNPFRMGIGRYYRFTFSVNDPSYGISHIRPVEFHFAPGRQTYPPAIDGFTAYPIAIAPEETAYFTCEAHDTGTWGSEYLIFRLDANGDGNYDTADKLGVLVDPADDPFRGVRRTEFAVKYNNRGIYGARCQVENIRQETVISDPLFIAVSDRRLGVVGRPNDNVDLETAIIPPDERFPAKYHLTLTELGTGAPVESAALTVSIDTSSQARLDSGAQSGSSIQVLTDAQGEVEFTYAFLDVPPKNAPVRDQIVIESIPLGIRKTVEVSVGLKPQVVNVTEACDSRTEVPRTLGLRIAVVDAFRPGLDLEAWIAALKFETGKHLGFAATTWWLNRPDPDLVQWIKDNIKGFSSPLEDLLYTNGRGWLKKVNDQFVFQAIDQPMMSIGPHWLPTLTLNTEGMHLFELKLAPVILPDDPENPVLDIVKSAVPFSFFFGTDVYGAESVLKSIVCAFSPTDADQFLLKSIILDCPLLTRAEWVGAWAAGSAIPYVLLVAEVADIICNFMEGNYFNIGAALAGKYLGRLDELQASGALELTDEKFILLKTALVTNSIKKSYDAVNDASKHFGLSPAAAPTSKLPLSIQPLEDLDDWPDNLEPAVMLNALQAMSAGFLSVPQMQGFEALASISAGDVAVETYPQKTVSFEGAEVDVLLYPAGSTPSLAAGASVDLFRIQSLNGSQVVLKQYQASASGENLLLSFAGDALQVDRGADGSVDELVNPESRLFGFLMGDMNLDGSVDLADGLLALQIAADALSGPDGRLMLPWAADVNGDQRIGLEEASYILGHVAGLRESPSGQ